jgi:hypothetical protein
VIPYVSRMGKGRNQTAVRDAGWGLLVCRAWEWRTEEFEIWAGDCGAWYDFQMGLPFNEEQFEAFLIWIETQRVKPQWVLLPDIVAKGAESLALSIRWMNRVLSLGVPMVLIAVQDGMTPADLAPLVGPRVGIFMGGSTEWKLGQAVFWGTWCASFPFRHALAGPEDPPGVYYHVARVNTLQRFILAHDAGAHSVDGSSAAKYGDTLELLERGRRQGSLLDPRRLQPGWCGAGAGGLEVCQIGYSPAGRGRSRKPQSSAQPAPALMSITRRSPGRSRKCSRTSRVWRS